MRFGVPCKWVIFVSMELVEFVQGEQMKTRWGATRWVVLGVTNM